MSKCSTLLVGVVVTIASASGAIAQVSPQRREIIVGGYAGLKSSLPADPGALFREVALAFSGTLQSVTPQFLASPDGPVLYTRLTFRPIEIFRGLPSVNPDGTIDVWEYGGAYVETESGPLATRPSPLAELMRTDSVYFVPALAVNNGSYLNGKFFIGPPDAIISLDGARALPLEGGSVWLTAVVAHGRTMMATPGSLPDDAKSFLTGIRQTAQSYR